MYFYAPACLKLSHAAPSLSLKELLRRVSRRDGTLLPRLQFPSMHASPSPSSTTASRISSASRGKSPRSSLKAGSERSTRQCLPQTLAAMIITARTKSFPSLQFGSPRIPSWSSRTASARPSIRKERSSCSSMYPQAMISRVGMSKAFANRISSIASATLWLGTLYPWRCAIAVSMDCCLMVTPGTMILGALMTLPLGCCGLSARSCPEM